MDLMYIKNLTARQKIVGKKLYAVISLLLVASLLLTSTSFAWLTLALAPEVTGITAAVGANGNLEIALNVNGVGSGMFTAVEDPSIGIEGAYEKNPYWGNVIDLSDERYGLTSLRMKPASFNYTATGQTALNVEAPFVFANYGIDGRITKLSQTNVVTSFDGTASKYVVSSNHGVRMASGKEMTDAGQDYKDQYAFCVDLLFRTNAASANLLLQTEGIDRIYTEEDAPEEWPYSDNYEAAQGLGSQIKMDNQELLEALRVAFIDTITGEIYGVAKADKEGFLYLSNDSGSAIIKPLTKNEIVPLTMWVYLDGEVVQNLHASFNADTEMKVNIQFATDALLVPAYSDGDTTSNPSTPPVPDVPVYDEYYIEGAGNGQYSFYTLKDDGSRAYELNFAGSMDEATQTVTLNSVTEYPAEGVAIPALATYTADSKEYSVSINPSAPFADLGTESAAVAFVSVDGEKVGVTSSSLSDLFDRNSGTAFASLNLSGLDTSTVTDMGFMLYNCSRLVNLNVTGVNTSKVTNMYYMFYGCSGLTELDVSGFDTSKVTNMYRMFEGCSRLTELDVSGFDTAKVTDMASMFYDCSGLTALNVTSFNTSKVVTMSAMFAGCSGLTELDVSGFDTTEVVTMSGMFARCSGLTVLDVSGLDSATSASMDSMFKNCSGLTELNLTGLVTITVTNMSEMFYNCYGLTKLDISKLNTSATCDMNKTFYNCSGLTELDLNGFTIYGGPKSMDGTFYGCSGLSELDFSGFDFTYVTSVTDILYGCTNLQTIVTPKAMRNVIIYLPDEYTCETDGNTYTVIDKTVPTQAILRKVTPELPSGVSASDGNVYYLDEGATADTYTIYRLTPENTRDYELATTATLNESNNTLTISSVNNYPNDGVVIPAVVTAEDGTEYSVALSAESSPFYSLDTTDASVTLLSAEDQFVGVSGNTTSNLFKTNDATTLASLDVSALDTSSVTDMSNTFEHCDSLESLNISEWDTSNVETMEEMFRNCHKLITLDVSSFNTSKVTNMGNMFDYCNSLVALDVSGFDTSSVEAFWAMFRYTSALTYLDVSGFDTSNAVGLSAMFEGCSSLTELDVSGFDTSNVLGFDRTFCLCENLTSLDVSNWDTSNAVSMATMFGQCKSLTSIDVSGFDTSNVTDMVGMFSGCEGLTDLDVSGLNTSSVISMLSMFESCSGLTELDVSNFDTSKVTNMGWMFSRCTGLAELDVSNINTSNVTDMYAMFQGCSSLTGLDLSSFDTSNVTDMGFMFSECTGLTSLYLSGFDISNVTNMGYMFWHCYNLQYLDLSGWDLTVPDTRYMFSDCPAGDAWV